MGQISRRSTSIDEVTWPVEVFMRIQVALGRIAALRAGSSVDYSDNASVVEEEIQRISLTPARPLH